MLVDIFYSTKILKYLQFKVCFSMRNVKTQCFSLINNNNHVKLFFFSLLPNMFYYLCEYTHIHTHGQTQLGTRPFCIDLIPTSWAAAWTAAATAAVLALHLLPFPATAHTEPLCSQPQALAHTHAHLTHRGWKSKEREIGRGINLFKVSRWSLPAVFLSCPLPHFAPHLAQTL